MTTPILKTERLTLRTLVLNDAEEIFDTWCSDAVVAKYMRWVKHENVDTTKEWLKIEEENIDSENYNWGFVLNQTGKLIGCGGFVLNKKHNCLELGYNFAQSAWGQGFATEASQKMLDFAKNTIKAEKIFCCHAFGNLRSQNVIEKLGFQYSNDGFYEKFDGTKYEAKEYFLYF